MRYDSHALAALTCCTPSCACRYERILAELLGKNAIGSISCSYANDDLAELTEFEYPQWWYDGTPFEVAGAT